jgi:rhodanese-related sulfurtransferase
MERNEARLAGGPREAGIAKGIGAIVLVGILLGVSYNWFGLRSQRKWGLPWIGEDKVAALRAMQAVDVPAGDPPPKPTPTPGDRHSTTDSDPFAVPENEAPQAAAALPEIPDIGRPVPIKLGAFERYAEAHAALILDARDAEEYREGHVPGARNLTYEQAATDPALIEKLDPGGRPIIVYCGGGECEVSMHLAEELIGSGFSRVAVYLGGFPEWHAANKPVERGE